MRRLLIVRTPSYYTRYASREERNDSQARGIMVILAVGLIYGIYCAISWFVTTTIYVLSIIWPILIILTIAGFAGVAGRRKQIQTDVDISDVGEQEGRTECRQARTLAGRSRLQVGQGAG